MSQDDILRDRLPETLPSDTPASQPETPAAPAKPGETRKFAGKYDSLEALEQAYLAAQGKISEQGESIGRLESLLLTPAPRPDQYGGMTPSVPTWTPDTPSVTETVGGDAFVTQADAVRLADQRFEERMRSWEQKQEQQRQQVSEQQYWRDEFYRRHPDLKDDDILIRGITGEVLQRYAHVQPHVFRAMIPTVLDEVAGKARERIAAYRAAGKAEAERAVTEIQAGHVPGAGGPVSPSTPPRAPTVDELRQDALRESFDRYQKGKQPLGR